MKVYLSPSRQKHNLYAVGNTNEMEQCYKIGVACLESLMRNNIESRIAVKGQETNAVIQDSNLWQADIHVCIHTNAANGKASGPLIMVYQKDNKTLDIANHIYYQLKEISLSKSNYGVRVNRELNEIVNTKGICIYIECEFHDNPITAQWIIDNNTEIGDAIAKGITSYLNKEYQERVAKKYYRVQVGAYKNKQNAKNMLEKLEGLGYRGYIVEN